MKEYERDYASNVRHTDEICQECFLGKIVKYDIGGWGGGEYHSCDNEMCDYNKKMRDDEC